MTEHAPLTPALIQLCNEIAAAPIIITSREMVQLEPGRGKDINFLTNAGFLNAAVVYVGYDSADSKIQITRSSKALTA